MDFDYTDYEYRLECVDGCGKLSGWFQSKKVAVDAAKNHEGDKGHHCVIRERVKEPPGSQGF